MAQFYAGLEEEERAYSPCCDGHVEAVSDGDGPRMHRKPRDFIRQSMVMRHLGEALDTVRKSEYARLSGRDRRYIKGPEVHIALAAGEPHGRRQEGIEGLRSPPTSAQYRLSLQGEFRSALGL